MPHAVEHILKHSPTAVGKGTVGPPPKAPPGREGVIIKAAIFFDGTKNNRTNTKKRLDQPSILVGKGKNTSSSYANYYSNVAIMELVNKRTRAPQHEVSVYVEGIGTNDFDEKAKAEGLADKKNGNDDWRGAGVGSGPTGIRDKVTKGINALIKDIGEAYDSEKQYIKLLRIDVVGFSRGAAAARHFVSRRGEVRHWTWPKQNAPELTINFVGLFETVSSFENVSTAAADALLWGVSSDRIFGDDVLQLGLDMKNTPKKAVHLTAGDEYRQNFSLTNINTTLKVGAGFELELPGVHSDIGGGYVERDPSNPKRDLNKEVRRIHNAAEKRTLIADGWYKPDQFEPVFNIPSVKVPVPMPGMEYGMVMPYNYQAPTVTIPAIKIWENGVRYLSNEYQYLTLYIMIKLATGGGKPKHELMDFSPFESAKGATYQVPGDLVALRNDFNGQAMALDGAATKQHIKCADAKLKWLRNNYLHRSARLFTEFEIGMGGRYDVERKSHKRSIIDDDDPYEKPQDTAVRVVHEKAVQAKDATIRAKDATVDATIRAKDATVGAVTRAKDATVDVVTRATNSTIETGKKVGTWVADKAKKAWNWRPWN